MARIIPEADEQVGSTFPLGGGEWKVLEAIGALDDEWLVYVRPRIGHDRPDFVAAHPHFGMCIVDVKDWSPARCHQSRRGEISHLVDGEWRESPERPRQQVYRHRRAVADALARETEAAPEFRKIRGVLVLPRATTRQAEALFAGGAVDGNDVHVHVYGYDDLAPEHLLGVLTGRHLPMPHPVAPAALDALHRLLAPQAAPTGGRSAHSRLARAS